MFTFIYNVSNLGDALCVYFLFCSFVCEGSVVSLLVLHSSCIIILIAKCFIDP